MSLVPHIEDPNRAKEMKRMKEDPESFGYTGPRMKPREIERGAPANEAAGNEDVAPKAPARKAAAKKTPARKTAAKKAPARKAEKQPDAPSEEENE